MKVVTEILQDLEILKRLLKHNANLKIKINYYLTFVGVMSLTRGAVRRSVNVNFRSMWPCYPGRFNVVRLCGMSIDKKKQHSIG